MTNNKSLGKKGEDEACKYAKNLGFEIIARNFRYKRWEVDFIARDGSFLVFIEVKTRISDKYGPPEHTITPNKKKHIIKAAQGFLKIRKINNMPCRFDFISVSYHEGDFKILNHIRNAFQTYS